MNEIKIFKENNPVPMLRLMAEKNPDNMTEQINNLEGKSFFLSLVEIYHNPATQREIYHFFKEYGYKPLNHSDKENNDYLKTWRYCSEDLLVEITQDFREKIEKIPNILGLAYYHKKIKLIELLHSYGVQGNVNIQGDAQLNHIYWKHNPDRDKKFKSVQEHYQRLLNNINAKIAKPYELKNINDFLKLELPTLNLQEKETLLALSVKCKSTKPYFNLIKLLDLKKNHVFPNIWTHLGEATHIDFLVHFLQLIPLNTMNNDKCFLPEVCKFLNSQGYTETLTSYHKSYYKTNNNKIWEILKPYKNKQIWDTMVGDTPLIYMVSKFSNGILNLIAQASIEQIFYKKDGVSVIENIIKHSGDDIVMHYLPQMNSKQTVEIFNVLQNNYTGYKSIFKVLEKMQTQETDWQAVNLLFKQHSEAQKVNTIIQYQRLNQDLSSSVSVKRNKI